MRFIALAPLVLALMGFAMPIQNIGAATPGSVKDGISQLDGKIKSTVPSTPGDSNPVTHNALGSRAASALAGAGGITGTLGQTVGAAAGKGSTAGKLPFGGSQGPAGAVGGAGGVASGAAGKLGGAAGKAGGAGGLVSRQEGLNLIPGGVEQEIPGAIQQGVSPKGVGETPL